MQQQTIETACYLTVNQHSINTLYLYLQNLNGDWFH